jgi:hypothetical protein
VHALATTAGEGPRTRFWGTQSLPNSAAETA